MDQLALFDAGERVLAEDERGRIEYVPRFVPPALAQAWFAELRRTVGWEAGRRRMYDREVDVPRLTARFDLAPAEQPDGRLPAAVPDAARRVGTRTGVPFTGVGLNLYRDGRDSVAAHNDHLHERVGERISLALRVRPASDGPAGPARGGHYR